jgi:SAM-dependent methyltransferase
LDPLAREQLIRLQDRHWWLRGRRAVYLDLLRRQLADHRPRQILDLGSGAGGFIDDLSHVGETVIALDRDPVALTSGRRRGPSRALAGHCEALPFSDGIFDLVCLFDVLEHTDDEERLLAEVKRVMHPGGLLALSVPAYPSLFSQNDRLSHHRRRYRRRRLRRKVRESGLHVERCTHTNVLLAPLLFPFVLALKSIECLQPPAARPRRTNLSWDPPAWAHRWLEALFQAELPLSRRWDLPAGMSILLFARAN